MKTTSTCKIKTRSLSVSNILALSTIMAALTACGGSGDGGGSSSTSTSRGSAMTASQQDMVSQSSAALVTQTGVAAVPNTTPIAQTLDPTTGIGDTWRVVLNQDGSFTVKVSSTQYSLSGISGTYTQSTSGSVATYTGISANGGFALKLDTRIRITGGNVVLHIRNSNVVGSGHSVSSDATGLVGDYFFVDTFRNVNDGGAPTFVDGTLRIVANGADITLCDNGLINAPGTCNAVPGSSTSGQYTLRLVKNVADGLIHVQQNGSDFGILSFQAGDHSSVLVVDRFGYNQDAPPVLRTGVFYAGKQQVLSGIKLSGIWTCSDQGTIFGTVTINDTTVKTADTSGASTAEALYSSDINTNTGPIAVNGAATSVASGQVLGAGMIMLLLPSSMFTVEHDAAQSVGVCR